MFPLLQQLAISLLTLPVSNAAAERVLSHVSLTKTDLLSKMSLDMLENILCVNCGVTRNGKRCNDFTESEILLEWFNTAALYSSTADCAPNE
ncbi:hypothetical protein HPB48_016219 [Haemaphysalis longicornis]|uniref:HAT C-terminal dimerisation domain-containing protein n=1 Tax=Haemaphysalis longicornis TaxID=44386 RepID=A0A9J6F9K8_HAELO|nr:hypothetical protein HPB48_016219 [Haemaphysalis longicornis]